MLSGSKKYYLEAARGIASIIVVFHHFALAFLPAVKVGVIGTPLNAIFNGEAAVIFFFTLSGFLLASSFIRNPDLTYLTASAGKRLPRLMLPAGLSILCGFALMSSGAMFNLEASYITQSRWLASMGNAHLHEGFEPGILDALEQTLTVFLFNYNYEYNSNLWTMRHELYGSFMVFLTVLIVLAPLDRLIQLGSILLYATLVRVSLPVLTPFVVGVAVAFLLSKWEVRRCDNGVTAIVLLLMSVFGFASTNADINVVGSALVILGLNVCKNAAEPLSGTVGKRLGELSFPLYLVHTLVILSASSFAFVALAPVSPSAALVLAALVTFCCSLVALLPFIFIDRWWVRSLNAVAKKLQARISVSMRWLKAAQ